MLEPNVATPGWNALCRIAESNLLKSLRDVLEGASLFVAGELSGEANGVVGGFFLPFVATAIECTIDTIEGDTGNACILIVEAKSGDDDFNCAVVGNVASVMSDAWWFAAGKCHIEINGHVSSRITHVAKADPSGIHDPHADLTNEKQAERDIGALVQHGMKWLEQVNTPDRFVVEAGPRVVKEPGGKKIARGNERPLFTFLRPGEIRQYIKHEAAGTHASPEPHVRRKHIRTLQSPRFRKKHGQQIVIPATWVGPSEAVYRGRRYKVRLDL